MHIIHNWLILQVLTGDKSIIDDVYIASIIKKVGLHAGEGENSYS